MKKFILHIIYFSVALTVVLTVVDMCVTYLYHHKDTRKYVVWNDILHTDIDADVLIMGNSRAWGQYSPRILDSILHANSYNIGMDGSALNRQIMRYDIYRHYQHKKPAVIIQNIEDFTLNRTYGYEHEQFLPYMMYPYFRERVMQDEPFSFAELYIPMYRYYINNVYDDYTKFDFMVCKGYGGEDKIWDGRELAQKQPYHELIDSVTYKMFIDYIVQTKEEEIQMAFVYAPMYKKASKLILNHDCFMRLYQSISKQYDVPLLDYSDYYLSYDTTYFYNAMHLNRRGAELFSLQLAHDLDSLGIITDRLNEQ